MTAVAVKTPASLVHDAHAALHLAADSPKRAAFRREVINLALALRACAEIDPDSAGWGWTWPRLNDEDDRKLLLAAEKAETAAGALIAAMRAAGIEINQTNETTGVAS